MGTATAPAQTKPAAQREVTITRTFDAPRELVFSMWTDAKHLAAWWGPHGFDNPKCEADPRPGGKLLIHMRAPDGTVHPMGGVFHEITPHERVVFSSYVELPDGTSYKESAATMPGDLDVTITEVVGIKLGMSVCYDLRFPELYRRMGALGAQVMSVPAAFTVHTGKDHWHALLRARAIENLVYVVAAAQPGPRYSGHSAVVDPVGDIDSEAGDRPAALDSVLRREVLDEAVRRLAALSR